MRDCSWAIVIRDGEILVFRGQAVEASEGFICEGAWAGNFSAQGLLESEFVCGSGAIRRGDTLHVIAPSHSVEYIYYFAGVDGSAIVSNSIHAIIALRGDAAPSDLDSARTAVRSVAKGFADYQRCIYQTEAGVMYRFAFGGIDIDLTSMEVSERPRPRIKTSFRTFEEYRDLLLHVLSSLVENAASPLRSSPYTRLITTCSSGYDSAACAVLARKLGTKEALTVTTARGGRSDAGEAVARALGLKCYAYEREGTGKEEKGKDGLMYLSASKLSAPYEDFLGSINSSEDLFFSKFEPHLQGAVLLTGFHGDKAWNTRCESGPYIKRGDNSGSGLDEFRKRVRFVNVPVPFIGIEQNDALAALSNSPEMRPYHVAGDYNRPIPRRIVEEAGIPRGAFGQKKSAGSVLLKDAGKMRRQAFEAIIEEYRSKAVPPYDL